MGRCNFSAKQVSDECLRKRGFWILEQTSLNKNGRWAANRMLDCYNYGTLVGEDIVQNCIELYCPISTSYARFKSGGCQNDTQALSTASIRPLASSLRCGKLQILPVSSGKFRQAHHYLSSSTKTKRQLHKTSITYRNCVFQHSNHWSHLTSLRLMQGVSRAPTNSPRDLHWFAGKVDGFNGLRIGWANTVKLVDLAKAEGVGMKRPKYE